MAILVVLRPAVNEPEIFGAKKNWYGYRIELD